MFMEKIALVKLIKIVKINRIMDVPFENNHMIVLENKHDIYINIYSIYK